MHIDLILSAFLFQKEIRDLDAGSLGEHNILNKIYDAMVRKYNLSTSTTDNKLRFMAAGYQFGDEIIGHSAKWLQAWIRETVSSFV